MTNATFNITDVFKITGRGVTLVGEILEGTISIGDDITFMVDDEIITKKIVNIGNLRTIPQTYNVGLIIGFENESEVEQIKKYWKPNTTISIITKSNT